MSEYEEGLQNRAEREQLTPGDGPDEKAYWEVFRVLKKDPGYTLDAGFAERVTAFVQARKRWQNTRDFIWFGAGSLVLLVVFGGTLLYAGFNLHLHGFTLDLGFLSVMSDYKGLAIFGLLFIAMLNWIDKNLIRRQSHKERLL